jgi:trans-aconitate methyltransferase
LLLGCGCGHQVPPDVDPSEVRAFSFMELNSGVGNLSMAVARKFPRATVVSLEEDTSMVEAHVSRLVTANVTNNYVCASGVSPTLLHNLHKAPEFLRFQVRLVALLWCSSGRRR